MRHRLRPSPRAAQRRGLDRRQLCVGHLDDRHRHPHRQCSFSRGCNPTESRYGPNRRALRLVRRTIHSMTAHPTERADIPDEALCRLELFRFHAVSESVI
jgi:hypothetical protein